MLDYETLDTIADSYVPILAALSLVTLAISFITDQPRLFAIQAANFCSGLLVAYGLMFLESYSGLWASFGLDYSTHLAVSLVFVIFLSIAVNKYALVLGASLIAYTLLMLYQGYHSVADIVTTALVVGVLLLPGSYLFYRNTCLQDQH